MLYSPQNFKISRNFSRNIKLWSHHDVCLATGMIIIVRNSLSCGKLFKHIICNRTHVRGTTFALTHIRLRRFATTVARCSTDSSTRVSSVKVHSISTSGRSSYHLRLYILTTLYMFYSALNFFSDLLSGAAFYANAQCLYLLASFSPISSLQLSLRPVELIRLFWNLIFLTILLCYCKGRLRFTQMEHLDVPSSNVLWPLWHITPRSRTPRI